MKWVVLLIGNSILVGAIAMAIAVTIVPPPPPPEPEVKEDKVRQEIASTPPDSTEFLIGDMPTASEKVEALTGEVDAKRNKFDSLMSVNESLKDSMELFREQLKMAQLAVERQQDLKANVKELAKTFESMKSDEMAPILKNLNNAVLVDIYSSMSSRSRKKFLVALSDTKAAEITQLIVANSGMTAP